MAKTAGKSFGAALSEVGAGYQQPDGGVHLPGFTEELLEEVGD